MRFMSSQILVNRWGVLCLALTMLCVGCHRDDAFPSRPLTLLCPWSVGGGTDRVSRQVAYQLEQVLGVPVNVINATGGSGVTGHTRGSQARPDGYTLAMVTVELNMLHWRGLTSVNYQDFQPLHLLNRDSAALFVKEDSPYKSLDELRNAIRSEPGKLKSSGTAFGGIWHVAVAGWLDQQGLDPTATNWISINGSGPSIQELNAGGLDFICCSLPEVDTLLAAGKVRCLGVMADERVDGFEEVATFKEQGHEWSIAGWRGLAAPLGVPAERLSVIEAAVSEVAQSEELREFMGQAGFNLSLETASEFGETLQVQDRIFEKVLTGPAFESLSGDHFGPMLFPSLLLAILFVLGVFWSLQGRSMDQLSSREPGGSMIRPLIVIVACVFYLSASEWIGFVMSSTTVVFSLVWMAYYDRSPWYRIKLAGISSVLLSISIYQVFAVWLRVPLPRGWVGW